MLQLRKTEIQNRLQNGQSQDSSTIGGNSCTEDEWKKIIQKMDEYLTEVKQEQKERFEKRDKEKEIQQFYEKMKMAEQYKKPQQHRRAGGGAGGLARAGNQQRAANESGDGRAVALPALTGIIGICAAYNPPMDERRWRT